MLAAAHVMPSPRELGMSSEAWSFTADHYQSLKQDGYVRLAPFLGPGQLEDLRLLFDSAWSAGDQASPQQRCWILRWEPFRVILGSPSLLSMLDVVFDGQPQLLDYYPNYQPPTVAGNHRNGHALQPRDWHRDFTFVRDRDGLPLMITVLTFLDDVTAETGPTLVIPGSHRIPSRVVARHDDSPRSDELALPVRAGEVLVLNSSIIHSRGVNLSSVPRRGLVLNFGYWWMKPWDMDLPLPQEASRQLSEKMQILLGLRCPGDNLYLISQI